MTTAIVGWTGLLGQTLVSKLPSADRYNSSNIQDATGKSYDIVYFCGMPAEKWRINQNSEQDYANTQELIRVLKTVHANRFVLVSTVDVLDCTVSQDETGATYATHPYGQHRHLMERFVSEQFPVHTIVRLPGLFGKGLKKNILYDLIYDNQISNICLDSEFQWYNIDNILQDINACIAEERSCVQLVSPPISVRTIIESFFPEKLTYALGKPCATYNLITNSRLSGYWTDIGSILHDMGNYIQREKALRNLPVTLAVSNIAWNHAAITDIQKVLAHNRIRTIEIAPTKIADWKDWTDNTIRELLALGTPIVSCQSVLFNTNIHNIFVDNVRLIEHYERVASICGKLGVSTIVFGSPKARHATDVSEEERIELFRTLGQIGEKYNVFCCLEPNARAYGCTWLTNLSETVDFVKKVDHAFVRITYDLGNYLMEKDTFVWDSESIDLVGHVQVSNEFLRPIHALSRDAMNAYSKQIRHILALGYSKRVSMEMGESSIADLIQSIAAFTNLF
jgi:sugar phosphate isomerase/epimerase